MSYKIDVFIPTSKNENILNKCLKSLNNQSLTDFSIFLVGKERSNAITSLISKYKKLKINYFIQKKKGLVGAANDALAKSNSDIFIRIDDDTTVSRNWLKNIALTFSLDSKIGGVTGPTLISDKSFEFRDSINFLSKFDKGSNIVFKILGKIYKSYLYENKIMEVGKFLRSGNFTVGANFKQCLKKKPTEVENFEACNFACRTSIIKKLGGFDKTFTKGLGDYHEADIAFRIRKSGYKLIFNPKAKLWHHIESEGNIGSRPDSYNRIKNFIIFYRRHMKINNADTLLRFLTNLILQNGYYIYKFISTGKINHLGAIPGTITGLLGI